jgi:hypothetical protein
MGKRRGKRVKYYAKGYREYRQPISHFQLLSPVANIELAKYCFENGSLNLWRWFPPELSAKTLFGKFIFGIDDVIELFFRRRWFYHFH